MATTTCFRDDVSMLKGNHLFQFGGTYQRNWDYHQRTDNGGGINYQPVYQLGTSSGAGIDMTSVLPAGVPTSSASAFGRDYAAVLGIVSIAQIALHSHRRELDSESAAHSGRWTRAPSRSTTSTSATPGA